MKTHTIMVVVGAVALLAGASCGQADEPAIAGRKIMDAYKDAVVKVKLVVQQKMLMNGNEAQNTESKTETTGTVIDPSGLVLVSLSSIDPSKLVGSVMKNMGQGMNIEMRYDLKDAKLVLPDDTEVDAKVVLRDNDWDMAFIRPTQKLAKPIAAVDLKNQAQPQILDEIIIINRLGKVASHVSAAEFSKISAVVPKPRLFYVPQLEDTGLLGTPVFTMDRKIVGVTLMRSVESGGGGMAAMMGGAAGMGISVIVLPASEILEASKQALAEPKEETKVEESKGATPKDK